jgi:septal ring factor EnvC (AmiA/AmiB activator)
MSTTEEIINSATAQTQNAASKLPEIGANNPSKKLKNIIILFGFLLIASLLANMIMYFVVSGNGSKVKGLEDRNAALSNQLASKSNLADRSQVIEQQLKKATDDLAAQVKINEDASSKVLAAEKSVKDNKDELTSLRAKVAASDAQINNLKAAKADAEGAIANIKKSLGSLAN